MANKIKVTIGLCVKNASKTIKPVLEALLNQDFTCEEMEIIVVDGCSKDETLPLIKRILGKTDLKYRIFQENTGLGMARQIVVDNAKGDYIIWVDRDIVLSKNYIRKQVEFMDKNPEVGIAEGRYGKYQASTIVAALENIVAVVESDEREQLLKHVAATEGAIWRVKAIKQAGGFDKNIKGAGEDTETAYRIKAVGWKLCATREVFYEICPETWKSLWDQYFWYGYGGHFIYHKDRNVLDLYKMTPIAGFLAGILYSIRAYKLKRQKFFFLLPIHYVFKRIAWIFGFMKGHFDGYGH